MVEAVLGAMGKNGSVRRSGKIDQRTEKQDWVFQSCFLHLSSFECLFLPSGQRYRNAQAAGAGLGGVNLPVMGAYDGAGDGQADAVSGIGDKLGYLGFALLFALIMSVMNVLYNRLGLGEGRNGQRYRTLSVTIPESLDYSGVFDEVLRHYITDYTLTRVKTTNMGSLFRLSYNLTLREGASEKELIDHLRCRNGNLEIMLSIQESAPAEL